MHVVKALESEIVESYRWGLEGDQAVLAA